MKTRYALMTGTAVSFAAAMLVWRFASRRRQLPCPSWLTLLLENPYMNWMAGAEAILDRISLEPGMKLLDIGCGPGRLTLPAARRVGAAGEVLALDIQPAMLSRARQKVEAAGLTNVRFMQAGAGDGSLESAEFDRAILVTVLGEIPDRKRALGEVFRALKPGGVLSVTEVLPDPHYQRLSTVRELAHEVGFEEQRCFANAFAFTVNFAKPEKPALKVSTDQWGNVSNTLLVPLYLRARESRRRDALLRDEKAVELVRQVDFNFSRLQSAHSDQIFVMLRACEMDRRVRAFLAQYPGATVCDIGCGLDTRFHRVDNGQVTWFDLDLPEVITIRRQLLAESPRCHVISGSALDLAWQDAVEGMATPPILFLAEGIFPYFDEAAVKRLVTALCERFPGSELVFDAMPTMFVRFSALNPILRATHARLGWGLDSGRELERWHPAIHLIGEWFYFDQPERRLRWWRLLKWFDPISKSRIVHLRFGTERQIPEAEHSFPRSTERSRPL